MTKVFTREILEALSIDATPLTNDQIFERKQEIEKRWLQQFREQEEILRRRWESQEPMKTVQAKIGEAAQSALHSKGVVIPSLYGTPQVQPNSAVYSPPPIDDDAVTEVINATVTYITMGRDFEIILQAIKDNPLLMSEWERFMLSLRLAQED